MSSLINVTEPCQYLEDPPSHRERIPIFTSPQHIDKYGLLFKIDSNSTAATTSLKYHNNLISDHSPVLYCRC